MNLEKRWQNWDSIMRNAFADEITKLAEQHPELVILSADIGNRFFDKFKQQFPSRFYNCGIAESNMIGVAAGMALSGLRPLAYTIAPFITARCFEQIRVDVCYHRLAVIIVGMGSGFSYASLNATHHSLEDIGILRLLPNMKVVCPGDPIEVRLCLRDAFRQNDPVYIRLGKKGEPMIHPQEFDFKIGRARLVRTGSDICFLSTGAILPEVIRASEELASRNISAEVTSFHTVKPLDTEYLSEVFSRFPCVVTVEEHGRAGGLGGSIAEWLVDHPGVKARLLRIGIPDQFLYEAGDQKYARELFGLTGPSIAGAAMQSLSLV